MSKYNKLLYGKDKEEEITCIEPVNKKNIVRIFKKGGDSYYDSFDYLIYVNENEPLLKKYETLNIQKLLGGNHYNRLIRTKDRDVYRDFKYNSDAQIPFSRSQYMLQSGKTCFKGMELDDLLILYFDLEVYTHPDYEFPVAQRNSDKIIMVAIKTNQGFEKVLRLDEFESETDLIKKLIWIIRKIDPDVIANHNIFNFDLSYLETRCNLHGIKLAIGRDGSEPYSFDTKIKFADRDRKYTNYSVFGRSIIDTQFLAEYADVSNRDMPSYQLKDLVIYLGKASEDRVYIKGEDISTIWDNKHNTFTRDDLEEYAIEDVREAEILYKEYGDATFLLTKMTPMNYQEVFRYGTGNEVEYIFWREYYEQNWSYPKNTEEGKVPGGYTDILQWGVFKDDIVYVDVKSLYPTLADRLNVQPAKDELKLFPKILDLLIDIKYNIDKEENKAFYNLVKIFLNTMSYGFIASPWNSFSDYDQATRITEGGQKESKKIIKFIEQEGGTVIRWDTDGGLVIPPDKWKDKLDEYCEYLTEHTLDGIIVENDGICKGVIPFGGKSYAMLQEDGSVKKKGRSIIGRNMEGFCRKFISDCIDILFEHDTEKSKELIRSHYDNLKEYIKDRNLEASDVAISSNINMSIEEYINRTEAGNTNPIAQYELARYADKKYMEGDKLSYYIKEFPYVIKTVYGKPKLRKKDCRKYEAAEFIDNYDHDYEVEHYLGRLDDMARKFMVFGEDFYYDIFSDITIYAKDRNSFKRKTGLEWKSKKQLVNEC